MKKLSFKRKFEREIGGREGEESMQYGKKKSQPKWNYLITDKFRRKNHILPSKYSGCEYIKTAKETI